MIEPTQEELNALIKSDEVTAVRAAARIANAFKDLFNDYGELPEINKAFKLVEQDISHYEGLENYY